MPKTKQRNNPEKITEDSLAVSFILHVAELFVVLAVNIW